MHLWFEAVSRDVGSIQKVEGIHLQGAPSQAKRSYKFAISIDYAISEGTSILCSPATTYVLVSNLKNGQVQTIYQASSNKSRLLTE